MQNAHRQGEFASEWSRQCAGVRRRGGEVDFPIILTLSGENVRLPVTFFFLLPLIRFGDELWILWSSLRLACPS